MIGVTVISHNQDALTATCLMSLNRTSVDFKVLFIDDASDEFPEKSHDLGAWDYHIRFNQNQGVQNCRNHGYDFWKRIGAEHMLFCDGDIVWEPYAIDLLFRALEGSEDHVGYAYGDYVRTGHLKEEFKAGEFSGHRLQQYNFISTMSLVKTACLPEPPFVVDEQRLQDWSLWLRMLNEGYIGVYVPKTLFTAYYLPGSVSVDSSFDYWKNVIMNRYVVGNLYEEHKP